MLVIGHQLPKPARVLLEALRAKGGSAKLIDVSKYVWVNHERELRESGDLLYRWQYDLRWAAQKLRNKKMLKATATAQPGMWELSV